MNAKTSDCLHRISPFVRLAHDFPVSQSMTMPSCCIEDHALHVFKSGSGVYTIENQTFHIEPGTLFLVRPGIPFSFQTASDAPFHMLNLHFDLVQRDDSELIEWPYRKSGEPRFVPPDEILSRFPDDADYLPRQIVLPDAAMFEALFRRVHAAFSAHGAAALSTKSAMIDVLAYLLETMRQNAQGDAREYSRKRRMLQKSVAFMRSNLHENIALADIAAAADCSKSYLSSTFKAEFGISPMQFLQRLRFEKARVELAFGTRPIKAIAHETGCASVHHFSRVFKQHSGMPPARYRALHSPLEP